MQPQQQPMGPSSMISTPPTETSQCCHQEQSNLLTQSQSPATVQGGGSPQQFIPASNDFFNPDCQSVQQNGTHFQPHISTYTSHQTVLDDQNGHNSVATLTPSPDSLGQHGTDLAHPAAINQQTHSKQMGHNYPVTQNFYPMHNPAAVPSGDINAWVAPQNCLCGPSCNCLRCTSHPFNRANFEFVQELTDIMASENYWEPYPPKPNLSQPQSATGNALTYGTDMEPAMDPMDGVPFTANPLGNIIIPEPTFDDIDDSNQSNELASSRMEKGAYWTVGYVMQEKGCTDATGRCVCGDDCACPGCRTHRGHVENPNL